MHRLKLSNLARACLFSFLIFQQVVSLSQAKAQTQAQAPIPEIPLGVPLTSTRALVTTLNTTDFPLNGEACNLERFQMALYVTENKGSYSLGEQITRTAFMAAFYKTNSISCLKKYGIVQYIKGCQFTSRRDPSTGKVKKYLGLVRDLRGKKGVPFIHRNWEVDTVDLDPMYLSSERKGAKNDLEVRFDKYQFPLVKLDFHDNESVLRQNLKYLANGKYVSTLAHGTPSIPELFVSDTPDNANFYDQIAINTSLKFQTCVYDIKNIPTTGNPQYPNVPKEKGGPIKCYSWKFIEIYDHNRNVFESSDTIDPFCE